MAIRMMQLLNAMAPLSSLPSSQQEIHSRTYWACFIIDRLVFSGKYQPLSLPIEAMNTNWPIGEQDYAFGHANTTRYFVGQSSTALPASHTTLDYAYSVIICGFEIWTKVYHWIVTGGRRKSEMLLRRNLPWAETSLWTSLRKELQDWRDAQDPRLRYPETAVGEHASLGKGERFAYINLIYYIRCLQAFSSLSASGSRNYANHGILDIYTASYSWEENTSRFSHHRSLPHRDPSTLLCLTRRHLKAGGHTRLPSSSMLLDVSPTSSQSLTKKTLPCTHHLRVSATSLRRR